MAVASDKVRLTKPLAGFLADVFPAQLVPEDLERDGASVTVE